MIDKGLIREINELPAGEAREIIKTFLLLLVVLLLLGLCTCQAFAYVPIVR